MSPLYQRMHRLAAEPFVWGETDCMMTLADWVAEVRGADPAAGVRGSYDSAPSCQRATGWFTDPVAAVDRCLDTIGGLPRAVDMAAGDVAVLRLALADRVAPVGAIWLGTCWGCKAPDGVTTLHPGMAGAPLAAWAVGYAA